MTVSKWMIQCAGFYFIVGVAAVVIIVVGDVVIAIIIKTSFFNLRPSVAYICPAEWIRYTYPPRERQHMQTKLNYEQFIKQKSSFWMLNWMFFFVCSFSLVLNSALSSDRTFHFNKPIFQFQAHSSHKPLWMCIHYIQSNMRCTENRNAINQRIIQIVIYSSIKMVIS